MKKNSFIQGAMIATIGIVISKILGIIYVIPFYSVIGAQGGALYGYAYTIYSIFLNLSSVGIPLAISRLTSEYNALEQYRLKEKAFITGKNLITVLSIISFVILIVFAPNIADIFIGDVKGGNTIEDVAFVIRIIATAVLFVPTLSVTKGYLQGHKFITEPTISQVLEQLARVIIIIVGSYIAVKVLHFEVKVGVGIATFGATVGAIVAYIYLKVKMHKHRKELKKEYKVKEDENISKKDILKRIISYAAPFIISSLILSLYSFVDLSTVVKTMVNSLNYTVEVSESIVGIISTWGNKLTTIVIAISTGLVTSLIPNITASYVKKDIKDVQNKINKSLQILMYITLPMTIGLCILSIPVWNIFYGYNLLNSEIFSYYIFISIFSSIFTTLNVIMQALDEQKQMLIHITIGFIVKLCTNVPLMYLFHSMGLNAGHGDTTATILGFSTSIILMLISLSKRIKVDYKETAKRIFKMLFVCFIMVIVLLILNIFIPLNVEGRLSSLIITIIYSVIGFFIYLFLTVKNHLIFDIFGETYINKIKNKLRLFKK
jgi:O-antigen/teichoic acid export membrane protein